MNKKAIRTNQNKSGGLHLYFRDVGETMVITHKGQQLKLVFQGRSGNQCNFSVVGPKDFRIDRERSE